MRTTSTQLGVMYILFAVALVSFIFFGSEKIAQAQQVDAAANAQCNARWASHLSSKCDANCADGLTAGTACSGSACHGVCSTPMGGGHVTVCAGVGCGNQPEGASDQGAQQAMDMAKQLMDALQKQAGGGGGSGGGDSGGGGSPTGEQQQPPSAANFSNPLFSSGASSTSVANFTQSVEDAVSGASNAAANFVRSVFGGNNEQQKAQQQVEQAAQNGEATGNGPQPVVGATGPRTKGTGNGIQTEGGPSGLAGSIADFFGRFFNTSSNGNGFMGQLCTARPWQATFVTRIFSANFFDSLCTSQGYGNQNSNVFTPYTGGPSAGVATLNCPATVHIGNTADISWDCGSSQSAGYGFDTRGAASGTVTITPRDTATYYLRCGNGGGTQCTINVEKPRAQITAYPAHVALSARSEIFWTSENVTSCTIEGPGLKELGIRGAATTPAILSAVTYTMLCSDDAGRQAYDSVTIDVGN